MKIKSYSIVTGINTVDLWNKVNNCIRDNKIISWQPFGSVYRDNDNNLCQPVVEYEDIRQNYTY